MIGPLDYNPETLGDVLMPGDSFPQTYTVRGTEGARRPAPLARQMKGLPGRASVSWAPVPVAVGRALPHSAVSRGSQHFSTSDLPRGRMTE